MVCIDSQSSKTTEVGGKERGYDGGKKIKGRKRHILVDVLGLLVAVVVTAANLDDGTAAPRVIERMDVDDFPRMEVIFGDNKYNNKSLNAWMDLERPGWRVEVQKPPAGTKGFSPIRIRWVVERSNAWHSRCRRSKSATSESCYAGALQQLSRHSTIALLKRKTNKNQVTIFRIVSYLHLDR